MKRYVLKNTKTGLYNDGKYGWTPDINEAPLYYFPEPNKPDHHVQFVEVTVIEVQPSP